jgi:hypothetical protein
MNMRHRAGLIRRNILCSIAAEVRAGIQWIARLIRIVLSIRWGFTTVEGPAVLDGSGRERNFILAALLGRFVSGLMRHHAASPCVGLISVIVACLLGHGSLLSNEEKNAPAGQWSLR